MLMQSKCNKMYFFCRFRLHDSLERLVYSVVMWIYMPLAVERKRVEREKEDKGEGKVRMEIPRV